MEIERKFLVARLPDRLAQYHGRFLEQAYLSTDPVIRIRKTGGGPEARYVLTVKGDGLLSREEYELELTAGQYQRLWARAEGNRIAKTRYKIPWAGVDIELDVFEPPFAPLVYAEVEFADEAAARAFQAPDWFGREVTFDPSYTNAALSRKVPDLPGTGIPGTGIPGTGIPGTGIPGTGTPGTGIPGTGTPGREPQQAREARDHGNGGTERTG